MPKPFKPNIKKPSSSLRHAHPRNKRESIIKAAIKTFLENGYAGTSMNAVAQQAGVIKATIYSHFKDKEELFVAIIEELTIKRFNLDFAELENQIIHLSPQDFVSLLAQRFRQMQNDPDYKSLLRVVIGESERFPELSSLYVKTVIMRGMEVGKMYFAKHPELNIKDALAAAHLCAGSFVSLLLWQHLLGGHELMPLDSSRVEKLLAQLLQDRVKG